MKPTIEETVRLLKKIAQAYRMTKSFRDADCLELAAEVLEAMLGEGPTSPIIIKTWRQVEARDIIRNYRGTNFEEVTGVVAEATRQILDTVLPTMKPKSRTWGDVTLGEVQDKHPNAMFYRQKGNWVLWSSNAATLGDSILRGERYPGEKDIGVESK